MIDPHNILAGAILLLLPGCLLEPPPAPPPIVTVAVDYELRDPQRDPLPVGAGASGNESGPEPVHVRASLHWLGSATGAATPTQDAAVSPPFGEPLDTRIETVLSRRGEPFRAGTTLLRGLWLAPEAGIELGPIASSATATVAQSFAAVLHFPGAALPELLVLRDVAGLRIAVRATSAARANAEHDAPERLAAAERHDLAADAPEELARLRPFDLAAGEALTIVRPALARPGERPIPPLALVLELTGPAPTTAVRAVDDRLAERAANPTTPPPVIAQSELARTAIGARPRRGALMALTARYDLDHCLDILLCVGERDLIALSDGMPDLPRATSVALDPALPAPASTAAESSDRPAPRPTRAENAWRIEQAFFTALLPRLQRGELPPQAVTAMRRHLGVVAIDPTALEFALATSPDHVAFRAAVRTENERGLADRRARNRLLAQDWLAGRGITVPGFDPLAPRATRKAALHAFRRARAAATESSMEGGR